MLWNINIQYLVMKIHGLEMQNGIKLNSYKRKIYCEPNWEYN